MSSPKCPIPSELKEKLIKKAKKKFEELDDKKNKTYGERLNELDTHLNKMYEMFS